MARLDHFSRVKQLSFPSTSLPKKVQLQTKLLAWFLVIFCFVSNQLLHMSFRSEPHKTPEVSPSGLSASKFSSASSSNNLQNKKTSTELSPPKLRATPKPSAVQFCVPFKVASAATKELKDIWEKQQETNKYTGPPVTFSIIRDPLERLWSGFFNKCLHQFPREYMQCPNFPNARNNPPSFTNWLETSSTDEGYKEFEKNNHFLTMSSYCDFGQYDNIFHLSSPTINQDMAKMWIGLGVPTETIDLYWPTTSLRPFHDYHANATQTARTAFTCETLQIARDMLKQDYEGPYKSNFPLPEWATDKIKECEGTASNESLEQALE